MSWWQALLVSLPGALAGALGMWAKHRYERRKISAEGALSYEDLDAKRRKRIEELESKEDKLESDLHIATLEIAAYKRVAPAMIRDYLLQAQESEDVAWLLMFSGADLWCISSPVANGKVADAPASILWLSDNWEDELGRPLDEMLGTRWYEIVKPETLRATMEAESKALLSRVRVANAWLHGNNEEWVLMEWRSLAYRNGLTIARAMVIGRERRVDPFEAI